MYPMFTWVARGRTPILSTVLDQAVMHGPVVLSCVVVVGAAYLIGKRLRIL